MISVPVANHDFFYDVFIEHWFTFGKESLHSVSVKWNLSCLIF